MNWLILLNFIGILFSFGIIYNGFANVDSFDLVLGIISLIMNLSCLVFNLSRKMLNK